MHSDTCGARVHEMACTTSLNVKKFPWYNDSHVLSSSSAIKKFIRTIKSWKIRVTMTWLNEQKFNSLLALGKHHKHNERLAIIFISDCEESEMGFYVFNDKRVIYLW